MEGKLKEKLESTGLAFLCLSTGHLKPFSHWCKYAIPSFRVSIIFLSAGISGIICFALTIRLAYASLKKKLDAREKSESKKTVTIKVTPDSIPIPPSIPSPVQKTIGVLNAFNFDDAQSRHRAMTVDSITREVRILSSKLTKIIFF